MGEFGERKTLVWEKMAGGISAGGKCLGRFQPLANLQTAFDPILSIRKNEHLVFGGIF